MGAVDYRYFLGLDLSYSSTGVVLLDSESTGSKEIVAVNVAAGKPSDTFPIRATFLLEGIWRSIPRNLKSKNGISNTLVIIEGAAYAATYNAFMLGELNGVIKFWLATKGYDYILIPPTTLKKYATNDGRADKKKVMQHVTKKWDFSHTCNDIVDAYVLARMGMEGWRPR